MKNSDMSLASSELSRVIDNGEKRHGFLTKREHFAAIAMQGLLARGYSSLAPNMSGEQKLAREAVGMADALLEELAK